MSRSEERQAYLEHKHRGGQSGQKGGLYEDYYAAFQIVSYLAMYKDSLDTVSFQTQLENMFVDDLLIARLDKSIYHQLKNTQRIAWGDVEEPKTIANDFLMQIEDCLRREESFALKLVHSTSQEDLNEKIPEKIKQYSSAEHFDYQEDFNRLVLSSDAFKSVLKMIVHDGENVTDDVLVCAAFMFLGLWRGSCNSQSVPLMDIVSRARKFPAVNLTLYPDVELSEGCKDVFDAIEGFEYESKGNTLYWKKGFMTGRQILTESLQQRIIAKQPKDFVALSKLFVRD